ncbi:MAG: amidohydrolase family protein, partial [Muriicola sp.]|nr:amidohydrolase family protein [Muriicola sp.]NNK35502.1 amidohydrolase family protein [Eudoraea sp.]
MKLKYLIVAVAFLFAIPLSSQDYFPKNDGVKAENNNYTALTNARIYVTPTQIIENGILLIKDGKVVSAGTSVSIPPNSVQVDLKGKSIYPSFIDVYSKFGVEQPKRPSGGGRSPQYDPTREGFYWNDHIMPEADAINSYKYDDKSAKSLREAGFGVVNSHIQDGIARGSGVLVALKAEANEAERIVDDNSAQYFSFDKSVLKRQSYPTSLMGAMALLRQMYNDASWYSKGMVDTKDRSLEALLENRSMVQVFAAGNAGNILRADKIGDAFGIQYAILGGGNEFELIDEIKSANAKLIIPVNFPDAYDVSDPFQADYVSLKDMRFWNQAPSNPKVLADNGVAFSFTLHELKSPSALKEKIGKAIEYGLSEAKALEALTLAPATLLGKTDLIGTLQPGRYANFLITSGDVFDKETTLYENWVQGQKSIINAMDQKDIRGKYDLRLGATTYDLDITGEVSKPKAEVKQDTIKLTSKLSYDGDWVTMSVTTSDRNTYRMTARVSPDSDNLNGKLLLPDGGDSRFTAVRKEGPSDSTEKKDGDSKTPTIMPVKFPNVGYGYSEKKTAEDMLFRNATVWTGEAAGILENTDVLVRNGKISRIGKNLNAGNARVIGASGKHLTAGIIDEHSHIAGLAINEAGQNSSAEVKLTDVVDPNDMDLYHNLAGGVTTVQLLHGSANPIGGRSAILRLKWGESADKLIFENSPKFIKFALGENVKQSNWNSFNRFPQTRMGVEQVFVNYFQRAKEYDALKKSGK